MGDLGFGKKHLPKAEGRRQKAEGRGQKAEGRGQRAEGRFSQFSPSPTPVSLPPLLSSLPLLSSPSWHSDSGGQFLGKAFLISMLRIITQWVEAQAELRRICDRTHDELVVHKEATVREVLQAVRRKGDLAVLHYTAEFRPHHPKCGRIAGGAWPNWMLLTSRCRKNY